MTAHVISLSHTQLTKATLHPAPYSCPETHKIPKLTKNFKKSATSASYVSAIQNTHAHASILHKIFYVKVNHVKRHLVLPTLKYCLHSIGVNGATFAVLCWKLAPHSCVVLGAPLFEISWSTLHTCEINWRDGIVNTAHYKVLDLLWF